MPSSLRVKLGPMYKNGGRSLLGDQFTPTLKKKVSLSPCLHQLDRYHYYMNI